MDELLGEFVVETQDMLDAGAAVLVAWEANPADPAPLNELFRIVHTIKGSSGFFDLPRIGALAHAAETVLGGLRTDAAHVDRVQVSAVLAALDQMTVLTRAVAHNNIEPPGDDDALIAALDNPAAGPSLAQSVAKSPVLVSSPAAGAAGIDHRTVRVPVALVDTMMDGVADIMFASQDLARALKGAGVDAAAIPALDRLTGLFHELRHAVGQMRLVPIETLFAWLPRFARQIGDELDRPVHVDWTGGDTGIDREVIEALRDPLTHIIRNAIDHGIEPIDQRIRAGKPATGSIRLTAAQSGNRIILRIADDGRGIDVPALLARAIAAGVVDAAGARLLDMGQQLDLIFHPGLSTAAKVTGLSGRGVGMDVVRANIERIGGEVRLENRPGSGLTLTIDVPMTLAVVGVMMIPVNRQFVAIPRGHIDEILLPDRGVVVPVDGHEGQLARVRDAVLPVVSLETVLGWPAAADAPDRAYIIVRTVDGARYLLDVPELGDHQDVVVRPLPSLLATSGLFDGLTLSDHGDPTLLLDVSGIARRAGIVPVAAQTIGDSQGRQPAHALAGVERDEIEKPVSNWLRVIRASDGAHIAVPLDHIDRIEPVPAHGAILFDTQHLIRIDDALVPVVHAPDTLTADMMLICMRTAAHQLVLLPVSEVGDIIGAPATVRASADDPTAAIALIDDCPVIFFSGGHWAAYAPVVTERLP